MGRVVGILKTVFRTFTNIRTYIAFIVCMGVVATSPALAQALVQVPSSIVQRSSHGITLNYNGRVLEHRTNEGWNVNQSNWQAPYDQGESVYIDEQILQYLGLNLPKLTNIRSSTDERFRIVFDLEERIYIENFSLDGTITAGRPLELNLPAIAVPWGLNQQIEDVTVQLFSDVNKTRIRFMSQQTRPYQLFSLDEPRRLVIDFGASPLEEQLAQAPVQPIGQPAPVAQPLSQSLPQSLPQPVQQPAQIAQVAQTQSIQTQATASQPIAAQVPVQPVSQQPVSQQPVSRPIGQAQPIAAAPSVQIGVAQNTTQAQQLTAQDTGRPIAPLSGSDIGQSLNALLENASDIAAAAEQTLKDKTPTDTVLRNGVRYRRFPYSTAVGESIVHVIEVSPGHGEFRVVGSVETPRTISELANGAFLGINAGYFDPSTHTSIGLLKIAGAELAEPTRNRASVAFGPGAMEINRVLTQVTVSSQGQVVTIDGYNAPAKTTVYTAPNARVGVPGQGVIIVKDQRVIENKIGPRTIPFDGYAIVYDADITDSNFRSLALLNPGDVIQAQFEANPKQLLALPYAVEAGPLLIENGQSAYNPDYENFENAYILNGRTHQAAIGARADGTVLLVAAEAMVARELIPLFTFLGAEKAMRLDSGSSTQLFVNGQLLNKRSQRRVVSGIVYLPN